MSYQNSKDLLLDSPYSNSGRVRQAMKRMGGAPRVCCCCLCLASKDRKRVRRIFKLARQIQRNARQDETRPQTERAFRIS